MTDPTPVPTQDLVDPVSPVDPPEAQPDPPSPPENAVPKSAEDYDAILKKLRNENAGYRIKLRDAEPIIKAHTEAEEAAKTEVQRATDRANVAEQARGTAEAQLNLLRAAARHGIPEEDHDLLGSGTPEELDARAAKLASRYAPSAVPPPPPSDRPVEGLRPGASPTPPAQPDNAYPESWRPAPPRGRT